MFTEDRDVSRVADSSFVTTTRASDVVSTTDPLAHKFNESSGKKPRHAFRRVGLALLLFAALSMSVSGLIGNLLRIGSLPGFTLPVAAALFGVVVVVAGITYFASDRKNRSKASLLGSVFVSVAVTLSMVALALFIWSVM